MEADSSILGELEDQVTCWICFEVFDEPVTLNCGHSFCKVPFLLFSLAFTFSSIIE
jgi:hypothetical protein